MTRQRRLRRLCQATLATASLSALATGPVTVAVAADKQANTEAQAPSELAREGMAKMLQALNKLIESVPQFEMPEMNENGDIILRRKNPSRVPVPQKPAKSEPDHSIPL